MTPVSQPWKPYRRFTPFTARALSVLAIGGLWGWFLLKFLLPSATGLVEVLVGVLALASIAAAIPLMLSTYAFRANAPATAIDERELAERNRAYFVTVMYASLVALVGYLGVELASRAPTASAAAAELTGSAGITFGVASNFLQVLFLTTIAFPTAVLAWWDRDVPDAE